tara:strand:- start:159 stop:581 length:423 start_codon:yes stop_codon:yes gene_type:complete
MGIISNSIKTAFEDFHKTDDEFALARKIFHIGDYSIRCQKHSYIGYDTINQIQKAKEEHAEFIKKITDIIYEDQYTQNYMRKLNGDVQVELNEETLEDDDDSITAQVTLVFDHGEHSERYPVSYPKEYIEGKGVKLCLGK